MDAAVRVGATFHVKHSNGASTQGSLPNERLPTKPGSASTRVPRARGNPQSYPQRYPPLFPRRTASRSTAPSSRKASSRRPSGRAAAMSAEARTGSSGGPIRPPGVRGVVHAPYPSEGSSAFQRARMRARKGCSGVTQFHPHIQRVPGAGTAPREPSGAKAWEHGSGGAEGPSVDAVCKVGNVLRPRSPWVAREAQTLCRLHRWALRPDPGVAGRRRAKSTGNPWARHHWHGRSQPSGA